MSTSATFTTSSPSAVTFLRFVGFFHHVFFSDPFMATLFDVISESIMTARREDIQLSQREYSMLIV